MKDKRFFIYAALFFMIFSVSSCCPRCAGAVAPEYENVSELIGDAVVLVDGKATDVKVGDEVAVVLEENPSTGYGWAYKGEPEGLVKEVSKDSKSLSEEGLIGAGVTSVWKFEAVSEGEVKLTYLYYRPWEGEETAIHKKEYIIKIEE